MANIDELKVLVDSIKEKLDETQSALVSEDLLSIVSNYGLLFDELTKIKEEVDKLKADNEELLKVNGRLFQKIGFDEDIKDESAELKEESAEEEITVEEVIDEKGEII
jgi:DNA anti-recombination protein RmuC